MSVGLTLDYEAFNRSSEKLIDHTSRTMPEFINGHGLGVSVKAMKHTLRANVDKIARMLDQVATRIVRDRKTGKLKKGRRIFSQEENTVAARFVNAGRLERGEKPLHGPELVQAAQKLRSARLSAVSFIASGWIYAIRELSKKVYGANAKAGDRGTAAKMKGAAKGYAIPATFTLSGPVTCEIANTALIEVSRFLPKHHSNPLTIAQPALQLALNEEAAEMEKHFQEKFQPIFDQPH